MHLFGIAATIRGKGGNYVSKTSIRKSLKFLAVLPLVLLLQLHLNAQTVTISKKNAPLSEVFNEIKAQTGFNFLIENKLLQQAHPVSLNVNNEKLETVLNMVFYNQPLSYRIIEKTIVVKQKENTQPTLSPSERIHVSGVVKNETGTPLSQASVTVVGTNMAVVTNNHGEFELDVLKGSELLISYVGYQNFNTRVKESKTLNVVLSTISNELQDVAVTVNTGYQVLDPRKLTSAITSIKAKDVVMPGMITIDKALEGRVPGLFVMTNSGQVGAAPKVRIRGTSTVLGNRDPVWVLDGVVINSPVNIDPQRINDLDFVNLLGNAISGLNPQDIDQIDVLKDASATALYGVRAANGVIVITTKKGHVGPPTINYSVSGSYTRAPRYSDRSINLMNSRQRIDLSREMIEKGMQYPTQLNWVGYEGAVRDLYMNNISYEEFQARVAKMETMNTDWFGLLTHDTWSANNNLSISGGTSKLRYLASLGATNENGVVRGDGLNRYNANINLTGNITDRLTMSVSLMANMGKRDYAATSVNALSYAYNTSRALPAYADNGDLSYYKKLSGFGGYSNYYNFNILNEMKNSRNITNNSGVFLNTNLQYKISDNLQAMVLFSYNLNNTNQTTTYLDNTFYAAERRFSDFGATPTAALSQMPFGGELQTNNVRNNSYTVRGQLNYNKYLNDNQKHFLNVAVGSEVSSNKYYGLATTRRGYMPDRGESFAPVDPSTYPAYAKWATLTNIDKITDQLTNLLSAYFTTSYTYNNRYTINFNTRTDASNKFGTRSNEKLLPTWSVSGRWDITQDFLRHSSMINMLALRASYGYQGNMLDNQTPEIIIKQGSVNPATGDYFSTIAAYPNPNLKWEKTGAINTSLDFSLFANKLSGSVSYFYKKTRNAFLDKSIADINGRETYVVNTGDIENKGVEVNLSFTPINNIGSNKNGFRWRIDPQLGSVVNKLISSAINHSQVEASANKNPNTYNSYLNGSALFDGRAINSFYSYQFIGLSSADGRPMFKNDDKTANGKDYAGMTNDQVFAIVMTPSGNRVPVMQGGISNFLSYKGFTLSANLTYSIGAKVRLMPLYSNAGGYGRTSVPLPEENANAIFVNRWRQPGDEKYTTIPGILPYDLYITTQTHWSSFNPYNYAANIWQMYDNSDVRVVSADYLKISAVSLSYKLPDDITKKLTLNSTYITLAGTDLYTFCNKNLRGQDPSQGNFSSTTQLSVRPRVSFNLNVTF